MGLDTVDRAWSFTRGLTLDFVRELDEAALDFSPGSALGPFWKQFRHVGRVQENYVDALVARRIRFDVTNTYRGGPSADGLADYLRGVDERMHRLLGSMSGDTEIDWNGDPIPLALHLERLLAHETLHHGQWIVYLRLMGGSFPTSWAAWGL